MNELEQVKKRIKQLSEHVERIEQEIKEKEEQQESRYPKNDETYYFIEIGGIGEIVCVGSKEYVGSESDKYYLNFCHGSTDKAEVEWTIKHIELINEIKKYTKDFEEDAENWYFYKERSLGTHTLETWCVSADEESNEYGYFNSQEEIDKAIEQFGEEYILKFLFRPTDGDYKAVMDWLKEWEENDDKPF